MGINNNLQILRGLAASLIVLVHIEELLLKDSFPYWLSTTLFSGVDIFFVISGFIIQKSISNNKYTAQQFILHRWLRVAPLYYLFTLAVFLVAYLYPALFKSSTADLSGLINSLTFLPYEKSSGRLYPLYYVGWSLNYEMFFYLLCCVKLFFFRNSTIYFVETVVVFLVIAGIFIPQTEIYEYFGVLGYFFTRPIMISFVFGALIARFDRYFLRLLSERLVLNCFLIVLSIGFMMASQFYFPIGGQSIFLPDTSSGYYFSIPAAVVVIAVMSIRIKRSILTEFLIKQGDASYSMYLSHYFVIAITGVIVNRYFIEFYVLFSILAFFVVILVSRLIYLHVECRFSDFVKARLFGVT